VTNENGGMVLTNKLHNAMLGEMNAIPRRKQVELTCPQCGKHVLGKRAFAGHMWLAHQLRQGAKWEMQKRINDLQAEIAKSKLPGDSFHFDRTVCEKCHRPLAEHEQHAEKMESGTWAVMWFCPGGGS